ncbi:MAG: hypothetical protein JWP01_975 [Myxococcales bacterium]|nr:hypothetical protein [Myxococcales bacterium]
MKLSLPVLAAILVPLVGCGDREPRERRELPRDPQRERRVIEPPVGNVRPLPPHAIRADGVGPYRIGEKLSVLLEQLPSGPRIAVFEIPGLLHRSLIRAEDNTVLIGGEPAGTATFVAVVGPDVARTESGVHVGSTKADVIKALGPLAEDLEVARDPRLIVPSTMRNARIILHDDKVAAIIVAADPGVSLRGDRPSQPACPRPASTERGFGACLTGVGELVEIVDNEIVVRAAETGRAIVPLRIPNKVVFAQPLRMTDGRDELVVVTYTEEPQLRRWSLMAYRFETGKIVRSAEPAVLYQVTSSNARWIGADLEEVELYLEVSNHADSIEVGGLLTTRPEQGPWRDVVVISPVQVPRRTGKSVPAEGVDAGTPDAADPAEDSGTAQTHAKP